MTAFCEVSISFDGTSKVAGTWTDISKDVMSCNFTGGRKDLTSPWGPGRATIHVEDDDRIYDPTNEDSLYWPNLRGGKQIRIRVLHPDFTSSIRTWVGIIRSWKPTIWGGDSFGVTQINCSDLLWLTNEVAPYFTNDLIIQKLDQARSGFYYSFDDLVNYGSDTDGIIRDLSGKGADGLAFTDELAGTIGAVISNESNITLTEDASIIPPIPADPLRDSPEGMFSVFKFKWEGNASPSGTTDRSGNLWGEGYDEYNPPLLNFRPDYTFFQLWHHRPSSSQLDGNPIRAGIKFRKPNFTTEHDIEIGLRSEWKGKNGVFILAIDANEVNIRCICLDNQITPDGTSVPLDYVTFTTANPTIALKRHVEDALNHETDRLFRIGKSYTDFSTGSETLAHDGFIGDLDLVAIGYTAASGAWADSIIDSILHGPGFSGPAFVSSKGGDRIIVLLESIDLDLANWTIDITSGINYNDAARIGGINLLSLIQDIIKTEQGRMFQTSDGLMVIQDFRAAANTTDNALVEIYSDGYVTDSKFRYKEDSFLLDPSTDSIINLVEVETSATGTKYSRLDNVSSDEFGVRSRHYVLPIQNENTAQRFAEQMLERFKNYRVGVSSVSIDPDVNPEFWWEHLMNIEIGERVTLERRPLNIGSTISIDSIYEGFDWNFSAMEGWRITEFFSPVKDYFNTINITENQTVGQSILLKKPYGVEVGDTLIILVATSHDGGGPSFGPPPGGFSENDEVGNATSDVKWQMYYKDATGLELDQVTVNMQPTVGDVFMVGAYIKVPGGHDFDVESAETNVSNSPSGVVASLTTTENGCFILATGVFEGADSGQARFTGEDWGTNVTVPARYLLKSGGGSAGVTLMFDFIEQVAKGAVSTCTFTVDSSSGFSTEMVAFKPT